MVRRGAFASAMAVASVRKSSPNIGRGLLPWVVLLVSAFFLACCLSQAVLLTCWAVVRLLVVLWPCCRLLFKLLPSGISKMGWVPCLIRSSWLSRAVPVVQLRGLPLHQAVKGAFVEELCGPSCAPHRLHQIAVSLTCC